MRARVVSADECVKSACQSARQNARTMNALRAPAVPRAPLGSGRERRPYEGVYLVGGSVRDILLGEPNFDVDIVVEGDAIALARGAGGAARRPRPRPRQVRNRGRALRPGRARRRRHGPQRDLRAPPRSADGQAGLDRRRPSPPGLHDQRDGRVLEGRDLGCLVDPFGGRERPARLAESASCTTARSSTTRRGSCARSGTRTGTGSGWTTRHVALWRATASQRATSAISPVRACGRSCSRCSRRATSATPSLAGGARRREGGPPHVVADDEAVSFFDRLRELNERYDLGVPAWRLGLAALARNLPPERDRPIGSEGLEGARAPDGDQIVGGDRRRAENRGRPVGRGERPEDVVGRRPSRHDPDAPLFGSRADGLAAPVARVLPASARRPCSRSRRRILARPGAVGESPRVGEILGEPGGRKLNGELDGLRVRSRGGAGAGAG